MSDEKIEKAETERQFLSSYRLWKKFMKRVKDNLEKKLYTDPTDAEHDREDLSRVLEDFRQASIEVEKIIENDEDRAIHSETFASHASETNKILDQLKTPTEDKMDAASIHSHSSMGSKSITSSERKAERAAKAARLKAELKFSEAEAEAQATLNKLKITKELAATQAEINALDIDPDESSQLPTCSKEILENYLDDQVTTLNPNATSFQPPKTVQSSINSPNVIEADSMVKLVNIIADKCTKDSLPKPEPQLFKGNILQYPLWKKNFETFIEQKTDNPSERLFYIGYYTDGKAKNAIKGYLLLDTEEAYQKAKEKLDKKYGDPFIVAEEYRKSIREWPRILPNDGNGIREFSDHLQSALAAMKTYKYLTPLNDPEENQKMLRKLPGYLVSRWSRIVDNQLNDGIGGYPDFSAFCQFIEKEARISCNPITSFRSWKEENESQRNRTMRNEHEFRQYRSQPNERRNISRNFNTASNEIRRPSSASQNSEKEDRSLKCHLCKKTHDINECPDFLKMPYLERFKYCQQESLCRGCLTWGHMRMDCRRKRVCTICKRFHPTALHDNDYKPYRQNENSNQRTDRFKFSKSEETTPMKTDSIKKTSVVNKIIRNPTHSHSQLVPVILKHKNNTNHDELTVCVIDEQSDACFIDEQLQTELGVDGPNADLELSTMHGTETISSKRISGLSVTGLFENAEIKLPITYVRPMIPAHESQIPRKETAMKYDHLKQIAKYLLPEGQKIRIGLLIGLNCIKAVKPIEVIPGDDNEPYGLKTLLGWGIVGMVDGDTKTYSDDTDTETEYSKNVCMTSTLEDKPCHFSFRTNVKEVLTVKQINNLFDMDFHEGTQDKFISHEDNRFMDIMKKGIHQIENGQFQMPLPFKNPDTRLPDNKPAVLKRLNGLKQKLQNDEKYKKHYITFMENIMNNGYSERVPDEELNIQDGKLWYLPHFGTYHPKKPDKLRIVFDASITYNGSCLNNTLLQGPDLTNSLLGVLCRFRQERIAFICDIESMFFRFKVNEEHRNYLRFFWWEENDFTREPTTYRMTVHLFGATSSPGCANYGLKATADLYEEEYGKKAADFIRKDFYVDDGLKSVATIEEAKDLIDKSTKMCEQGGLRLHKFLSNKKEVLEDVPLPDRAKDIDFNIDNNTQMIDRVLGVQWCIQNDTFQFRINLQDRPLTRRGILSTVSSVFDPLGLVSPCILIGKRILKELCTDNIGWDDDIPDDIRSRWTRWRSELSMLGDLEIQRSFCPEDFGTIKCIEAHHFSDASFSGIGQCTYIKLQNEDDRIYCTLAVAKSRVSPSKPVTIPRMELAAAVVSVKVAAMLRRELTYTDYKEYYWTDSRVVLGYIANDAKRFHIYVANRIQQIRNHSSPTDWYFVEGTENPADIASRGLRAHQLVNCERWWKGPQFLYGNDYSEPEDIEDCKIINPEDPEVKKVVTLATKTKEYHSLLQRFESFSNWHKLKLAISFCLRIRERFKKDSTTSLLNNGTFKPSTVTDLKKAEIQIIKQLQKEYFEEEIKILESLQKDRNLENRHDLKERKKVLKTSNRLYKLDPFIDTNGLLRVGGRIKNADIPEDRKYPIILPERSHITELIIRFYHERSNHQGRAYTHNLIRASGYWLIGGKAVVSNVITKCVICKRLYGSTEVQKMASLPKDRLEPSAPFTYAAVDYFGPFYVKEGRRELKRYGVIFVCMASRAVHLEVSNYMTTDSFLNAYRRFVCRRGPIRQLRSDQGTNFVGGINELQMNIDQMDDNKIKSELLKDECDWIHFKMNFPESSHMGGSWERLIRSVRKVLVALLHNHGTILDDETLRTFFVEAESIVNCRPLSVNDINDPDYPSPITPNQLLTLKPQVLLPPPGIFLQQDVYSKKRWRRVQFLANQFWNQWSSDYIQTLQRRPKWTKEVRNFEIDDVVLIKDDNLPRNEWKLGRVCEIYKSDDELVRKVRVSIGDRTVDKTIAMKKYLDRPIHKLVLLLPNSNECVRPVIPVKEPQ